MTTLSTSAGNILEQATQKSLTQSLVGHDWFVKLRQQGWKKFNSLPLPKRDDEKWRFSDTRSLNLDHYHLPAIPSDESVSPLIAQSQFISKVSGLIIHIDGHCVLRPSISPELAAQGVKFESLEDGIKHHPSIIKEFLLKHEAILGGSKFLALHQAYLKSGYLLHVPKGVEVNDPFVSVNWTLTEGAAVFPHALIIAEDRAKLSIHEYNLSAKPNQRALAISAADLYAGKGANISRFSVQGWSNETQSFEIANTCGDKDSQISSVNAALGSRRARLENTVRIDGSGADVRLYGISVANGEQEFDQRTLQIHQAGQAKSDLLFKNVLLNKSRTIFSGLIKVAPDAQQTDAYQTNRNLLLSPEAEADSMPGLEIEANDVKCSHGATTGQVNPEELFYLLARGIPLPVAQELLAEGFLEEVLSKVDNEESAAIVREMFRQKFHQS